MNYNITLGGECTDLNKCKEIDSNICRRVETYTNKILYECVCNEPIYKYNKMKTECNLMQGKKRMNIKHLIVILKLYYINYYIMLIICNHKAFHTISIYRY